MRRSFTNEFVHLVSRAAKLTTVRQRMERVRRTPLLANSLFLMVNSGATAILGLAFWSVATRLYSPADVGLGSALLSAVALLSFLGSLGLGYGLIRFVPMAGGGASRLINGAFTLSGLVSVAVALAFLAGLRLWSPALTFVYQHPVFVIAFVAFVVVGCLSGLTDQAFLASRRAGFVLARNVLYLLLRLVAVVALAASFGVFGIFAAGGLAASASLLVTLFIFLPQARPGYRPAPALSRQVTNEMVHFSLANYLADGLWSTPAWLLPLLVVNLAGAEANAYFYVAWVVAGVVFIIPQAIALSLFAEGSHREDRVGRDLRSSMKLATLILVPAVAIVLLIGDKVLLVFGRSYSEGALQLLWVLALSSLPVGVNYLYLSLARVQKRLRDIFLVTGCVGLATLLLTYLLLPTLGLLGPGVAWLASQTLVALAVAPRLWRQAAPGAAHG